MNPQTPNTTIDAQATPKRRRWLRFSLRAVLIAIAIIAVLIWIPIQRARTQRRAVEAIHRLGGMVEYVYRPAGQVEPDMPAWLRRFFGDDFFRSVYAVRLHSHEATDADLEFLNDLPDLYDVDLAACRNLTDAGLAKLAGKRKLDTLDLTGTQISDAGLKTIAGLPIRTLRLANTLNISDAGLAHLRAMKKLSWLTLDDDQRARRAPISDAGLAQLDDLNTLQALSLVGCAITDAAAPHLVKHTILSMVNLSGSDLSDDGLAQLAPIPNLRMLVIRNTAVTDAGLAHLKSFPRLISVTVGDRPAITDDRIKQIEQELPLLTIKRY